MAHRELTRAAIRNRVCRVHTNSSLYPALVKNVVDSSIIFLCSSAVEPSTVNRVVPGSNPGGGAKTMVFPTQRMSTIQSGIGIQHPFCWGPDKTQKKQLRLERDGYSIIVLFGPFVYRSGRQVFILVRGVRFPYGLQRYATHTWG